MYIWGLADAGSGWVKFLANVYKSLANVYKFLVIVSGQKPYTFGARAKNKNSNMSACIEFRRARGVRRRSAPLRKCIRAREFDL